MNKLNLNKYEKGLVLCIVLLTGFFAGFFIYAQVTANLEARVRIQHGKVYKLARDVAKAIKLDPKLIPSTMAQGVPVPLNQFPPPFRDAQELKPYYLVKTSKGLVFYRGEPDSSWYVERLERASTPEATLNLSYDLSIGTTTQTWKMVILSHPAVDKPSSATQAAIRNLPLWRYADSVE